MTQDMLNMSNERLLDFIQRQNFGSLDEINEFIRNNVNNKRIDEILPTSKGKKSDKEMSDDLIFKAYSSSVKDGIKLANEALKLYPGNIKALNYLAENAEKLEDSFLLYKKAVELGKEQLGDDYFISNRGHFWLMIESRPYMKAKLGYADCLGAKGFTEESIHEYQEMLILNPGDNQGIRYILSGLLLRSKKYPEFLALMDQFSDERSTFLGYNYALYLFITGGASPRANKMLREAYKRNKHILRIMTGKEIAKESHKGYFSPGDETEAADYLMQNLDLWIDNPEVFGWLFQFSATLK